MQRVIGGEFDIDISSTDDKVMPFTDGYLYSSGRATLYNILKHLCDEGKFQRIFLPDYLCESVLDAVTKFDFEVSFYPVTSNLIIDREKFKQLYIPSSIVLIINYFGCIDCKPEIEFIKQTDNEACVLQDNVQAYYAMFEKTGADFAFTSFRKIFAVPDGAWVRTTKELPVANERNSFAEFKIAGAILKHAAKYEEVNDTIYLNLLNEGEKRINYNFSSAVSKTTLQLINGIDFKSIAKVRRQNADFLIQGLLEMNISPIITAAQGQVPLFVPLMLNNRDQVRAALFKENIFCPVHWAVPSGYNLYRGSELAKNELSLIIDQRYGHDDMQKILNILKRFA